MKPGDPVKRSGVYSVRHHGPHVRNHDITCVAGNAFPVCGECGDNVRFLILRAAPHMTVSMFARTRASIRTLRANAGTIGQPWVAEGPADPTTNGSWPDRRRADLLRLTVTTDREGYGTASSSVGHR